MASSRLFVTASGQRRLRSAGHVLGTAVLLFLVLFTALVAPWPLVHVPTASAAAQGNPNPPLKAPPPRQFHSKPPDLRTFVKSNPNAQASILSRPWSSSAPALTVTLSTQAQQAVTQDGHLHLSVATGTLSATQMSSAGGNILLRISQVLPASGGAPSDQISFGTYLFQFQNASGAPLTGLTLAHPLTITYHLSPAQVRFLIRSQKLYAIVRGGDASSVISGVAASTGSVTTAPTLLIATGDSTGANWSISTALATPKQTTTFPFSTITFGTQSPAATWGTPQDFQVDLNAGGLMYTYPLDLPAGPGDFTPQLALSYTSGSVDESHALQAGAPWVGEGWNLSLGSISFSEQNVTEENTSGQLVSQVESNWHINDPGGISGQLIPPDLNAATADSVVPSPLPPVYIWHTAPESHAKVNELMVGGYPCWRVYLPDGVMEEFGCTDEARQSYVDAANNTVQWRWDLDLMIDAHGNQIHIHYNRQHLSAGYVRDAVLSSIEYDDPTCHNTTTACSTWNPLIKVIFNSSSKPTTLTASDSTCSSWVPSNHNNTRCDDPTDISGGLPAPKIFNAYVLNSLQVEVQGNVLHEDDFSYEQQSAQQITDPVSGEQESIAGYMDLTRIQEKGTNGDSPSSPYPVVNITYITRTQHYEDTARIAAVCPSNWAWMHKNSNNQCYLWSQSFNARYLSNLDNGRGWNESISWDEARNNMHGVSTGAINDVFACDNNESSNNVCGLADDENWSHMAVQSRTATTNGQSSTWSYSYYIATNLPSPAPCSDCKQGYDWGNQNDQDYADYYNGQFLGFLQAEVVQPDGSSQVHTYDTTNGWGVAESGFHCAYSSCGVTPYWGSTGASLAGKEVKEEDYQPDQSSNDLMQVHTWSYATPCPPGGVSHSNNSGSSPLNNPGSTELSSELDQNNPVVVCDPRVSQQDQYLVDGVTTTLSDSRVVHTTTTFSYDSSECGSNYSPGYDYGNVSQQDETANDVGGAHESTITSFCPMDNVSGGSYLTDLPVQTVMQDASGTQYGCHVSFYGGSSNYLSAPSVPDVTRTEDHTGYSGSAGCSVPGSLVVTLHTYDASGNAVTATDPDNHLGCSSGSNSYSACATYDSFETHLTKAVNAANQATTYSYDSTAAGGFGQWLTAETDANGQSTSYQYDVMGRLTAVIRPGDSSSNPTVSYTYTNSCTSGSTTPCIELDTTTTFSSGSSSTMKQWYDGWGHLVETQTPSPNSSKMIVTYTIYDTMGRATTTSLPYAITTPSGYIAPDTTQPRSVTSYDGLGRTLGSVTYSNSSNIVLESSISYTVAQGVANFSSDSSTAFEQTITLDAYSHQSITYTDGLGRTRYTQIFKGTASPYTATRTVADSYDTPGNTTQVQTYDSNGSLQASYNATFDGLKRRTGFNDSDLGSCSSPTMPASCSSSSDTAWTFTYDGDGNQLSQTDPRNQSTYTSYDVLDRPLCRGTSSSQVNPCHNSAYAQFFYDSYDNSSNANLSFPSGCNAPGSGYASDPIGHPSAEVFSSSAGSGWRCYGYDQRGQLDQSTLSITADSTTTTQTVNMSYNDGGEITQLVYPGSGTNQILTSQYDANGRFQSAYFGTSSTPDPVSFLVASTAYTGVGQVKSLSLGGSGPKNSGGSVTPVLQLNMSYDNIQRPLSTSASENGTTIWNQTRTYDNVGNVLQLSSTIPTSSGGTLLDNQSFCYDALNRLMWAGDTGSPTGGDHCGNAPTGTILSSTYQQSFSYDDLDRITSGPMGTVGYNNNHVHAANTLGSIPNKYATYDDMGNMTCRNVDTTTAHVCNGSSPTGAIMTYDNEGRLATWTAPTGTTASDSFLYDNEGNRVLQRTSDSNGITDTITFDGYSEKVLNGSNTTTSKFYSVNGMRLGVRVSSTLSYLLPDLLGSPTVALTSSGSFQAVQLFSPYGSSRYSSGSMPTDYSFTGQRLDSETGLIYDNFRYYDPVSGRFTRADTTLTNVMGMDAYAYVMDNPEGKTDPTGHCPWCIGAIVGAVIGAAISYGVQVYNNYQNHVQNPWTQNIDVTSIVAGALTGALIGATFGVGLAAGVAVYSAGATVVEAAQTGAWVAAMDLAYGTGEMIQSAQNDSQNEDEYALTQIERARLRAQFENFKSTGGRDPRPAGVIAQTVDPATGNIIEISGVSGSPVSDPYYGTGTCAEFDCAINGRVWLQNIDSSDRGEINLYLWHKNGLPPCPSCQFSTLPKWANVWGQPINISWIEGVGNDAVLTSDTYIPNPDAGLSGPQTHGGW